VPSAQPIDICQITSGYGEKKFAGKPSAGHLSAALQFGVCSQENARFILFYLVSTRYSYACLRKIRRSPTALEFKHLLSARYAWKKRVSASQLMNKRRLTIKTALLQRVFPRSGISKKRKKAPGPLLGGLKMKNIAKYGAVPRFFASLARAQPYAENKSKSRSLIRCPVHSASHPYKRFASVRIRGLTFTWVNDKVVCWMASKMGSAAFD